MYSYDATKGKPEGDLSPTQQEAFENMDILFKAALLSVLDVRTPTRCHIDLACNTSYHFAASRTVFPWVSPYLYPGPFAPYGTRI
jgi:hypothetical protein